MLRAARALNKALAGQVVQKSDFRVPQLATADLSGHRIVEVVSVGKHLLTRTDRGVTLHTHFRMHGSWHIYRRGQRWRGGELHEVRVILETPDFYAVGYRLPVVELVPTTEEDQVVGHLGPDILSDSWDQGEAVKRIRERPKGSIFEAILDQRNLSGIGNLYANETLFIRGVNPWKPVHEAGELEQLVDTARRLMRANVDNPSQSTTGRERGKDAHWVFERTGRPCLRCGTPISSRVHSAESDARLTYWCPHCQPV